MEIIYNINYTVQGMALGLFEREKDIESILLDNPYLTSAQVKQEQNTVTEDGTCTTAEQVREEGSVLSEESTFVDTFIYEHSATELEQFAQEVFSFTRDELFLRSEKEGSLFIDEELNHCTYHNDVHYLVQKLPYQSYFQSKYVDILHDIMPLDLPLDTDDRCSSANDSAAVDNDDHHTDSKEICPNQKRKRQSLKNLSQLEKYVIVRKRNNQASKKYRKRKKQHLHRLEDELVTLTRKNKKCHSQIQDLQNRRRQLYEQIRLLL